MKTRDVTIKGPENMFQLRELEIGDVVDVVGKGLMRFDGWYVERDLRLIRPIELKLPYNKIEKRVEQYTVPPESVNFANGRLDISRTRMIDRPEMVFVQGDCQYEGMVDRLIVSNLIEAA